MSSATNMRTSKSSLQKTGDSSETIIAQSKAEQEGLASKGGMVQMEDTAKLSEMTNSQVLRYAEDLTKTYKELREKVVELNAVNRKKTDYLTMVSHEMLTPVSAMTLTADLFRNLLAEQMDVNGNAGELINILANFQQSAMRLRTIMSEILMVVQENLDEIVYQTEPIALGALVEELVAQIRPMLRMRSQSITFAEQESGLYIEGSRLRVLDAFFNVVQNASKFSENGKEITVRLKGDGPWAVMEVEDHGIGIEREKLRAIFNPFYEDMDIMRHHSGTFEFQSSRLGMGLHITKLIIEKHGGAISAESEPGHGSTITITLPRTAQPSPGVRQGG